MKLKKPNIINYEPSPQEIRRACEKIQATWSPRTRRKREQCVPVIYTIPCLNLCDLDFRQESVGGNENWFNTERE